MSREGAKIPNDGQKMAKNGQRASKEREASPKDGQQVSKESEASPRNGQQASKEIEPSPKDEQQVSKESEASPKNGQRVSNERKPSPKDGQKESKENEASRKEEPIISREAANTSRAVRLGLFMVGSLIILAIGVFLIGNREMLFTSTYSLKSDFQTVAGLSPGADVRVGGIHEGTVMVMDMHQATREVLKNDSVASIKTEGLLGDKYMEISFGSPDAPKLKNGDTIQSAPPLDISDLFAKTSAILDSTKGAVDNIEGAADNFKSISAKVNEGKGTAGALVNDKTVYREAAAGATAFQENMEALKHNFFLRGFFKNRGYEDSVELRAHEIAQLPRTKSHNFQQNHPLRSLNTILRRFSETQRRPS